ncbi:AbgT family transporter [Phocaeicola sp.]
MKNRRCYFPHAATIFFLLTVAVALFSWIGSIYGLGTVQSLLSPEGIRWELRHTVGNFVQTPALGIVIILFLGLGIASYSGMTDAIRRIVRRGKQLTRKEKRALVLAACTLVIYSLMIVFTTFAPLTLLRSVTGSLTNSPFQKGIYYLISFGIGLSGVVFGYTIGRFRNDGDVIRGMASLFSRFADYFVVLFFIVQFFSSLMYTNLVEWFGIDSKIIYYSFHTCCYLPFLWMLNRKKIDS